MDFNVMETQLKAEYREVFSKAQVYATLKNIADDVMTEKMTDYIYERDLFRDTALDVTFARIDLVLNLYPNERNLEILRDVTSSPTRGGFVSIMIHEQYFHPDYISYIPEFETRVLDACRFLKDKGYRGVHLTELLGIPGTIKEALG